MAEKFSLRDFFIYIIPGSIWICNFYVLMFLYSKETIKDLSVDISKLDEVVIYIVFLIAAYVIGILFSHISKLIIQMINKMINKTKINKTKINKAKINKTNPKVYKSAEDIKKYFLENDDPEFVDDFLKLQNIENSWKRYRDLNLIITYCLLPVIVLLILITVILEKRILIVIMIVYCILSFCKMDYLEKQRIKELDKMLFVWYFNNELKKKD